jgi:hypothetical protein
VFELAGASAAAHAASRPASAAVRSTSRRSEAHFFADDDVTSDEHCGPAD